MSFAINLIVLDMETAAGLMLHVPTYCFVSGLTSCLFTAADKYRQSLRTVSKAVSQVLTGELELEEQKKADRNQA